VHDKHSCQLLASVGVGSVYVWCYESTCGCARLMVAATNSACGRPSTSDGVNA
jgi:hypothetical protein